MSTEQLREWTSRRALIPADVRPSGRGSPAMFAWPTVLLLRIASILRSDFRVELQAHARVLGDVRRKLSETQFASLRGKSLALYGADTWALVDSGDPTTQESDAVLLRLDPHLEVLAAAFALPKVHPDQLELFPRGLAQRRIASEKKRDRPVASRTGTA